MIGLRGTAFPPQHGFGLAPVRPAIADTLPPRRTASRRRNARAARWVFPAAVLAEGAWAFFGSLVLGLGRRDQSLAIPQAPWIWLGGTVLIACLAAWMAWTLSRRACDDGWRRPWRPG